MRWKDVRAGALSVLDPTGKAFPAQDDATHGNATTLQRLEQLTKSLEQAQETRHALPDPAHTAELRAKLSTLRFIAVAGSFTSAGLSTVLAIVSLTASTFWPVIIICSLSAIALLTIAAFFLALKSSLSYRKRQAHASYVRELRLLVACHVNQLDTAQLVRESADNPELARAFLLQILAEYEQVAEGRRVEAGGRNKGSTTVRQLMNYASSTHPVIQTLSLIASDFRERSA